MKFAAKFSEAAFQTQVIQLAKLRGWRVAHFRKARTKTGWVTPVAADGKGFLDLLLLRGAQQIVAELKVGYNVPTDEQIEWMDAWRMANVPAYLWYPEDWDKIMEVLA